MKEEVNFLWFSMEKNVRDNVTRTLFNIQGKMKDGLNTR